MPSEADTIDPSTGPYSVASLTTDIRALGVTDGSVLIVHSSLSKIGWAAGGAQAVVMALLEAVGPDGTIVMPTQSGQLTDPLRWQAPPIPAEWIDEVRQTLPAYDPHLTPTRQMGQIVECFRSHPGSIRSSHPIVSFAANGPLAEAIVGDHPLTPSFGEASPLAKLYEHDALVLLIGVSHSNDTSLHLSEHRASWATKKTMTESVPVTVDGNRQYVTYEDLVADDEDFGVIGDAIERSGIERVGTVGSANARLAPQRAIVDFGAQWMSTNR